MKNLYLLPTDKPSREVWKDVVGYEGLYQVSNFGNVKSLGKEIAPKNRTPYWREGKMCKQFKSKFGYMIMTLTVNNKKVNKYVHRLVAEAFIINLENKPQVNHIDGNKENNSVYNLEWCTNSENMIHGFKNGLCKAHDKLKEMSENRKKKVYYYNTHKELLQVFNSVKEAEEALNYKGNLALYCKTNQLTKKGIFSYVPLV